MRIWLVPFCELDTKRLVAQHHEWHAIENKIRGLGQRWKGWELPERLFEFYLLHSIVVKEMEIRGLTGHKTPALFGDNILSVTPVEYPRPREAVQEERFELMTRWGGGFHGRAMAQADDWEEVFARFNIHGGCPHERPLIQVTGGRMCPTCKKVFPIS